MKTTGKPNPAEFVIGLANVFPSLAIPYPHHAIVRAPILVAVLVQNVAEQL